MEFSRKQYNIIFLSIFSFILVILIFKWIDYLSGNKYIIERFTKQTVSNTVDLPLTTTYSCKNFCGPTARCSITGHQCSADIDCPGCQTETPHLKNASSDVPGDNDSGKLTIGVTPRYSSLTSGYGKHETVITKNIYSKPSMANFGVNAWIDNFNEEQILFDKRYKPHDLKYMPKYPKRYSLTGVFIEEGPFASNSTIPSN